MIKPSFIAVFAGSGGLGGGSFSSPSHRNGKFRSPANVTSINDFKGRFNSKPINTETLWKGGGGGESGF